MKVTFLGGAREVGASCTLLQVAGHRLLIDGGMRPAAGVGQSRLPDLSLLKELPPEALLITHAHIDHTGALPLIASLSPGIPIYATESTKVLTAILLRDAVRIMEQEGLQPDGETPLYTAEQVDALLGRIQPVGFEQPFAPLPASALTVRFLHAGHILGAAMLHISTPEGTLLHTGDISVTDQRTIKGLALHALPQADVMICEGTYGSRAHRNRKEEERKLAETVQGVLARGGRILCPAFAVGRAQEVVLILKAYRASGQVSPVPIYVDGMVRSVCTAYQQQAHDLHPSLQRYLTNARRPLFTDPDLHIFAVRRDQRQALLKRRTPLIIISSSGMLTGGASPLYAAELAHSEQDCILFTGYQDEESPGAALLRARQGEVLRLGEASTTLHCQVARYNLSGHADGEQLVHVVTKVSPKHLLLVHGAPESLEALAQRFPKLQVDIPGVGDTLTIGSSRGAGSPVGVVSPPAPPGPEAPVKTPGDVFAQAPLPLPRMEDLWQGAYQQGPTRPWTAVELGQGYYGASYRPALREGVERTLKEATPYFKQGRVGAQPTYLPRTPGEVEQLLPLTRLAPGEIVIVQGQKGTPQIGLLLSTPQEGTVSLVADQWKQAIRPLNVIQLIPGMAYPDLVTTEAENARQYLQAWQRKVEEEWVDLIAWWDHCQGKSFTYAQRCQELPSDHARLAWGLALLARGNALFRREGMAWVPLDAPRVLGDTGVAHHLELVHAGAEAPVQVNGRRGTLTGRSNWRLFEIQWEEEEGEEAGELTRVRSGTIHLLDNEGT